MNSEQPLSTHVAPITLHTANAYSLKFHSSHRKVPGCRFCLGLFVGELLRGVIIVGRPLHQSQDDATTAAITRLISVDAPRLGMSHLIGRVKRACKAMGYKKLVTYCDASVDAVCFKASGFWPVRIGNNGKRRGEPTRKTIRYEISL